MKEGSQRANRPSEQNGCFSAAGHDEPAILKGVLILETACLRCPPGMEEEDRDVTDSCFFPDRDRIHDPTAACLIKLFSD